MTTTSELTSSQTVFSGLFDAITAAARAAFRGLRGVFSDIELARNGGLTIGAKFYPFPERFADTAHTEAFKCVMRFALLGDPQEGTLQGICQAYGDDFGPVIPETVWLEVVAWFVEQGILEQASPLDEVAAFAGA